MAFTKGKSSATGKKAVAKSPANYARKKAQEEVEEVEEVVDEVEEQEGDEVQDDYDNEAEEPSPRKSFAGRSGAPRQSAQREPGKALRLTGMFAGKREGCFSGKLRDEDAENLKGLIEEAQSSGQQVVFFLWENQGNPQFSLTANISTPFKKSWGNKGGGWNRGGQNQNRGFRRY